MKPTFIGEIYAISGHLRAVASNLSFCLAMLTYDSMKRLMQSVKQVILLSVMHGMYYYRFFNKAYIRGFAYAIIFTLSAFLSINLRFTDLYQLAKMPLVLIGIYEVSAFLVPVLVAVMFYLVQAIRYHNTFPNLDAHTIRALSILPWILYYYRRTGTERIIQVIMGDRIMLQDVRLRDIQEEPIIEDVNDRFYVIPPIGRLHIIDIPFTDKSLLAVPLSPNFSAGTHEFRQSYMQYEPLYCDVMGHKGTCQKDELLAFLVALNIAWHLLYYDKNKEVLKHRNLLCPFPRLLEQEY